MGKVRNFAKVAHSHFQHRHLGILRHRQNGHRKTQIIIEIGWGLADQIVPFQNGGHHFFGGGFTYRTGDTYHFHPHLPPQTGSDLPQSDAGIFHHDGRIRQILPGSQHRSSPLFKGHRRKIIAVPHPHQRHKELPGLHGTRIIGCAGESQILILFLHPAAAPAGSLSQCDHSHSQFSKYSATISRSSIWCLTPITSW